MLRVWCHVLKGATIVEGTNSFATVLGIVLAGSSFTAWSASCQYSDTKVMDKSTFHKNQKLILREMDKLFQVRMSSTTTTPFTPILRG